MTKPYLAYRVWYSYHSSSSSTWIKSSFVLSARTDKEANSKTERKFKNAGFTSMSMVAVREGVDPNVLA